MGKEVLTKVLLYATFREKYGVKEINVKCNGTLENLIENIAKILGEKFFNDIFDDNSKTIKDNIIFAINGRNIKDIKGEVEIKDGDEIAIFPPLAGG